MPLAELRSSTHDTNGFRPSGIEPSMRITENQKHAILQLARVHFGADCRVTLFGSRANNARRGGDLDLLIETSLDSLAAHNARVRFLVDLKREIGDRQIDLVVAADGATETSVIRVARREGVLLG